MAIDLIKLGSQFAVNKPELAEELAKVADRWFVFVRLADGFQQSMVARWDALVIVGILGLKTPSSAVDPEKLAKVKAEFLSEHGMDESQEPGIFCLGIVDALRQIRNEDQQSDDSQKT